MQAQENNPGENIHNVPVPERFLPLVTRYLADLYAAEARGVEPPSEPPGLGPSEDPTDPYSYDWDEEEVLRAYREVSPAAREGLLYIATHSDEENWVTAEEVASAVFPDTNTDKAVRRLFGTWGRMTRLFYDYGKHWFFKYDREALEDGTHGQMVYHMLEREAGWIKKAAGIE